MDVKAYGDGIVGSFMKGFTGNDGTVNVHAAYENYVAVLSDTPVIARSVAAEESINPAPAKQGKRGVIYTKLSVSSISSTFSQLSALKSFSRQAAASGVPFR